MYGRAIATRRQGAGLLPVVIAVGISGSIASKPGIAPRICRRAGGEYHQRRLYRWDDWWQAILPAYITLAIIKTSRCLTGPRGFDANADRCPFLPSIIQLPDYGPISLVRLSVSLRKRFDIFPESMGTSSNLCWAQS